MKKLTLFACLLLNTVLPLAANETFTTQTPMQSILQTEDHHIILNNRPLAKVHGKTFNLVDVVKKMDLFIQTNYPKVYNDKMALYQFYTTNWKQQLEEMVENELILVDAELKEVEVSDGDIREEINERYGPNVFAKLFQLGLTLEEAQELVRKDILVRQMMWFRAYSKARLAVTPEVVKNAYTAHLAQFEGKDRWQYNVLTLKGDDEEACETLAKMATQLLSDKSIEMTDIATRLNEESQKINSNIVASASQDYDLETPQMSTQHLAVLSELSNTTISEPVAQKTRSGSTVKRIFNLKDHFAEQPENFDSFSNKIQDQLLNEHALAEKNAYIQRLKERFYFSEDEQVYELPSNYEPFSFI